MRFIFLKKLVSCDWRNWRGSHGMNEKVLKDAFALLKKIWIGERQQAKNIFKKKVKRHKNILNFYKKNSTNWDFDDSKKIN